MPGPVYTYSPTVPQGGTPFNETQSPILSNFQAIAELLAVNHVAFNANDFGKHNYCSMQSRDTLPPTGENNGALYCSTSTDSYGYAFYYVYPDGTVAERITNESIPLPDQPYSGMIKFANGFTMVFRQGPASTTITFPAQAGYKYAPFVGISQINGSYYPYTRHGAYDITQTGFKGNLTANNFWSYLSFGF